MVEYVDVLDSNGKNTNQIKSREECHEKGLYHKIVIVFVLSPDNKEVLLQKRKSTLKYLPNLWDITAGGHVKAFENSYSAAIRETYEEIGLNLKKEDLEFLISSANNNMGNHFVDYYIVHQKVNIKNLKFNKKEIEKMKWFKVDNLIHRINDGYNGFTKSYWEPLIKYLKNQN